MSRFDADVESYITEIAYTEYQTAKTNQSADNAEFEQVLDLLECRRTEKEYDWMSDIFIPEYPSLHLTESSQWANQYFQGRDFVDIYLEDSDPKSVSKCRAAKTLINKTLNCREVYHYHKYLRARAINSIKGEVYAVCYWEREIEPNAHLGYETVPYEAGVNEAGEPVLGYAQQPLIGERVLYDRFNYEVIDPRNVFTIDNYAYSIQEKTIEIRSEVSLEKLKEEQEKHNYFNLDKVEELQAPQETETSKETYNYLRNDQKPPKPVEKMFDRIVRYGKLWVLLGEEGRIRPGIDRDGKPLKGALLRETVTTFIFSGGGKIMIGFEPQRNVTKSGIPYKPIVRGLCYIHPTRDTGMSDGKYARELQVGLNDTVNMSNDRVHLATLPTLKVKKNTMEDNDTLYFEPEHSMFFENSPEEIQEFRIRDDINGAMTQAQLFISKMQQVSNVYPPTMGQRGLSSTTATEVAGTEAHTNLRANYKSLTFEYTFLVDFYWMILQMTYQYMRPDTALKILGQDAYEFDPDGDYTYQPVSSNIEQEYSKFKKIQNYDQMIGRIAGLAKGNPAIIPIIAYIVGRQCELLGDEYRQIAPLIQQLARTPMQAEPEGAGPEPTQPRDMQKTMLSNQNAIPVSLQESYARNM